MAEVHQLGRDDAMRLVGHRDGLVSALLQVRRQIAGIKYRFEHTPKSEPNLAPSNVYPAVPEWQLVPKEPTDEQCCAGHGVMERVTGMVHAPIMPEVYRAMLASSPPAPEQKD